MRNPRNLKSKIRKPVEWVRADAGHTGRATYFDNEVGGCRCRNPAAPPSPDSHTVAVDDADGVACTGTAAGGGGGAAAAAGLVVVVVAGLVAVRACS